VTYETKNVQTTCGLFCMFAGGEDVFVLVELAFLDAHVDAHDILPDDATSADV
jgi:hypothetical protein